MKKNIKKISAKKIFMKGDAFKKKKKKKKLKK